jgi:MFS transporter, Spinster family, sphingosine-1-phosphate transporter
VHRGAWAFLLRRMMSFARRPNPWCVVAFLAAAAGINYADRAALSAVIPPLRDDLGLSDFDIGLVGSAFLWSYALASPFAGMLADRFSRSLLVACSLVLWSLVTLLCGTAAGLGSLVALRIALGFSESLYLPAAGALLGDHHGPATRGLAMGLHVMGLHLGVIFGGLFAGLLAERFGWRAGFFVLGVSGLGLSLLAPSFLGDVPTKRFRLGRPSAAAALAYLVRTPTFHVVLLNAMLGGVAVWIFFNWLPLYFRETFQMSLGAAGFAGTFLLKAPAVIGLVVCGWWSDRISRRDARRRLLLKGLAFVAAVPALLLFLGNPGFKTVMLALALFSLMQGFRGASEHPILCDVVPAEFRSTAIGLLNTAATAAGGVGVLLAGALKADLGLGMIFAASSALMLVAGILSLLACRLVMEYDLSRCRQHSLGAV